MALHSSFLNTLNSLFFTMTTPEKTSIERKEPRPFLPMRRHIDDIFEDFRNEMESMFHSWQIGDFQYLLN
jgi:hypothetical protein